jgi:hypothetical protein
MDPQYRRATMGGKEGRLGISPRQKLRFLAPWTYTRPDARPDTGPISWRRHADNNAV